MNGLETPFWAWLFLAAVVAVSLTVDLLVHRGGKGQGRKTAVVWSVIWIALAVAFGGWVALEFGHTTAQEYFTAYLVEKSLSVDNLFVFLVVFSRLKIPEAEQHRVLHWGIIGAFVTRGLFIAAGAAMLHAWHDVVYLLGAFLIYTGIRTAREHAAGGKDEAEGKVLPFVRRHLRLTTELHGHHFIARENGRRVGTPLFLALIVIEITDVLFAVDSIPAVFAITQEPFIVYSSNVFAILGLRALYLVLADLLHDLKYLHFGLAAILVFAGLKMIVSEVVHIPHLVSLLVIVAILVVAIVPSILAKRHKTHMHRVHSE